MDLPYKDINIGLDLLALTQNFCTFLQNYSYNIHSQQFFESPNTSSRFLNVVSVKNIQMSLKTHGLGIIKAVVQKVY